ncbi:MAG: hypothetical protein E7092_00180 [Bacteroidales bacterium]|nr:hypothetical protein [Bacteroidales bacterium]
METIRRFAEFFYGFCVDMKLKLFTPAPQGDDGLAWLLIFLLGSSALFAAIYYFGVERDARNATPKNYLSLYIAGYLTLVAVNFVGLASIAKDGELPLVDIFYVSLIDIIYYSILFEIHSLWMKGLSKNSKCIDIISILFNKNI